MIITVNPKTHKVLMTSIPRDYLVELQMVRRISSPIQALWV